MNLQNKVVFITGSNRGIGKAILETLIDNGASRVCAAVRDTSTVSQLIETYGSEKVIALALDLSKPTTSREAAQTASDIDIVINNAAILIAANPLEEHAIQSFNKETEINVHGLIHMAQAFAPILKKMEEVLSCS